LGYLGFLVFLEPPSENPITPPGDETNLLPSDPGELGYNFSRFFSLLFSSENFTGYLAAVGIFLVILLRALPFLILLYFAFRLFIRRAFVRHNNDYNKDTMQLKGFKRLSGAIYEPPARYLGRFWQFARSTKFPRLWVIIWLLNFNVFAILLSMIAAVLHFSISFQFVALYYFFYNSLVLLGPAVRFIPWWALAIFVLWLIDRWRKRKALESLRHMESMNMGFIKERSICVFIDGTMGTGKTTAKTDMNLSTEAIFRTVAQDNMMKIDMMFPNFPWINFENELRLAMDNRTVFNLASALKWVKDSEYRFVRSIEISEDLTPEEIEKAKRKAITRGVSPEKLLERFDTDLIIFHYKFEKHGLDYDDKKVIIQLWDALADYAKSYFLYVVQSSLILSNHAIRTDAVFQDIGNFPAWNLDFFERDTRLMKEQSRHSKILDFDMLRLGKKLIENNERAHAFEFGIIAITEGGKERGNQFKDKEIRETISNLRQTIKDLERAKQDPSIPALELERLTQRATHLTDKFNDTIKLIRHKSTIMGFPFARVFMDDQRPESLGADCRDLFEIVHITEKSETRLAMPFHFFGELLHAFTFPRFRRAYETYRFHRGDNTLLMFLLKKIGAGIHRAYSRIYNRFGYHVLALAVEDAATGKIKKESHYYLSHKKIYSNRFSTDAYAELFAQCKVGVEDMPEYKSHKATKEELLSQNSYFINEITKYGGSDEQQK